MPEAGLEPMVVGVPLTLERFSEWLCLLSNKLPSLGNKLFVVRNLFCGAFDVRAVRAVDLVALSCTEAVHIGSGQTAAQQPSANHSTSETSALARAAASASETSFSTGMTAG